MAVMNKAQFEQLRESATVEHDTALQAVRNELAEEQKARASREDGLMKELTRSRQDLAVCSPPRFS